MEIIMKNTLRNALIALITFSSSAFAAGSAADGGGGLLITLFVGFFALILIFQLVPATLMFIGMAKGLLSGKAQIHY
jgi:hypothetical protein